MKTRIKFCGMTRREDLAIAAQLGVDAVGFVLVPKSQRFVNPPIAIELRRAVPSSISVVALLQDADAGYVSGVIAALRPDLLQFHGAETPEFCDSFGAPYLKAVPMSGPQDVSAQARRYPNAAALLLDSHAAGGLGGTGKTFDWTAISPIDKPIVLAGGLDAGNVAEAIRVARPYAVDVSSGIEHAPGLKDSAKMRDFVAAVRSADRS